jgi:hypothetical protein
MQTAGALSQLSSRARHGWPMIGITGFLHVQEKLARC